MDAALIQIWNALVRPRDVVWYLSVFAHGPWGTAARVFARLNGEKHLVVGNHDAVVGRLDPQRGRPRA